jgi:hypothetical protein
MVEAPDTCGKLPSAAPKPAPPKADHPILKRTERPTIGWDRQGAEMASRDLAERAPLRIDRRRRERGVKRKTRSSRVRRTA